MLPHTIGDMARPSPALLSVVYLWSRHLSAQGPPEKVLLSSVLHHLSEDLSGSHPRRVLHTIQAEVLLSYYYLRNGKVLEGIHHADAALSLSIASDLHRVKSPDIIGISSQIFANPIEEGEHIDAFWTVLALNNHWSVIQKSHSVYLPLQTGAVDTPWPMDAIHPESPVLPVGSRRTLEDFLDGRSSYGLSEKALYAKSSILFERSNAIHNVHDKDRHAIVQSGAFAHLDSLINVVQSSFPPIDGSNQPRSTRVVTQMLLYAAIIKLHRPFSHENKSSYRKLILAAQSIAHLTRSIPSNPQGCQINPIIGVVWALACETLTPLVASQGGNEELVGSLDFLVGYMTRFSDQNPLFSKYPFTLTLHSRLNNYTETLLSPFQSHSTANANHTRQSG
ncbi:hypothetical protein DXG01_003539 [Tephrocybe rancida]|nr:hypothetical protein DXG01_003539 [Tephrocybe rancida]